MKWHNVISATHGVQLKSKEEVSAWEMIIKRSVPDLKSGEVSKALTEAMERCEPTKGFRMTALDLCDWIRKSRNGWKERSVIKDGWEHFPDRARVCGQIQKRKIND